MTERDDEPFGDVWVNEMFQSTWVAIAALKQKQVEILEKLAALEKR